MSRSVATAPRRSPRSPPRRSRSRIGASPAAAGQLIADALDLRHRHPLLWKRVDGSRYRPGRPAASPNRPTASRTPAPGWVDEQLATRTGCGPVIVDRLVAQAIAQYDPEDHEKREDDAKAGWDVTLTHPEATDFAGTSHLEAHGDTLTLKAFYDLV